MNRSAIIAVVLAQLLLGNAYADESQPNMVVVLVDDHAFEAISSYGTYLKNHARTPTIDRLAKEGMRFDNFVCCNSICSPSRAAILTGQYSHKNGVKGLNGSINDDSPQYPVELQKTGYQTWLVGKWHLKSQPKGYDKHMIVKGQGSYFDPTFNGTEGQARKIEGYSTDVYTDIAMKWLKERDRKKPFLLSLQFKAPHHDYGHAKRYDDLLADTPIPEPPSLYEDVRNTDSNLKRLFLQGTKFHMLYSGKAGSKKDPTTNYYHRHLKDAAPNAMWEHDPSDDREKIRVAYQHMMHKYIRCATGNDDNLKRVLDYLDAEGLTEDTIVIYTSDQGYWLGQHGFYDKRLILETSMRMPFLIRYPRLIKPGSVNNDLCINVDIAPTLLDCAGARTPDAMQGRSMVPLLNGDTPQNWRETQFYTYWGVPEHYGVRSDRYTYFKINGQEPELFDRAKDPHQVHNVYGNSDYRDAVQWLESELQSQIKDVDIDEADIPGNKRLRKQAKR